MGEGRNMQTAEEKRRRDSQNHKKMRERNNEFLGWGTLDKGGKSLKTNRL